MSALHYVKHESVSLKDHPEFNEPWLQEQIRNDPSILGLGELAVVAIERSQPKAGRLDILMRDPDTGKRYEIELMLGTVDESHIIRCIEYWDIERKRYPQFEHTAVLVAENITTRFLNVISLFTSVIPIVAIQLNALKVGENILLNFTKVLDEVVPGEPEDEGENEPPTDRAYWERRGTKETLRLADEAAQLVTEIDPTLVPTYRKYFIGFSDGVRPNNFVVLRPRKKFLNIDVRISDRDSWRNKLSEAGIEALEGGGKSGRVPFTIDREDFVAHRELIADLFRAAWEEQRD
jgi:hypothetical protein